MKTSSRRIVLAATVVVTVTAMLAGCRRQKQPALPAKPPQVVAQTFSGPQEGFPPQVRGRTNVIAGPAQERTIALTDAVAAQTRAAALQDQRVRALLGSRFTFISIDELDPEKGQSVKPGAAASRITLFSYTNNVAVVVRMNGLKVEDATRRDNYQPPEGTDEIREAIDLAGRDERLRGKLQGLDGHAILTLNTRGAGHRVLRVTFRQGDEDVPRYFANVDMSEQKVLSAGAVADENKERQP